MVTKGKKFIIEIERMSTCSRYSALEILTLNRQDKPFRQTDSVSEQRRNNLWTQFAK